MSLFTTALNRFGAASGPGGTRRVWIFASVLGVAGVVFAGSVVYRIETTPKSELQKVPRTQTGTGTSGTDQVRRSNVQQQESMEAEQAHMTGRTSVLSVEDSVAANRQARLDTAASQDNGKHRAQPRPSVQPDGDLVRGYLVALNRAMASMSLGNEVTDNFAGEDPEKPRAGTQKASLTTDDKAASSDKAPKRGLGLAGQRVMATTVLAATMDPDSGKTPALVQMTSGPLAGYRLQGTIDKHDNSLTIPLDTLYYEGEKLPVKATLVSPETQEVTVACDVDHKILLRVGIPAAVGVAQGLGQAAQESGSTFVTSPIGTASSFSSFSPWRIAGTAAGGAANGVQSVLRDVLPKGSTVTLCADVPVEVFFEDDVYLTSK